MKKEYYVRFPGVQVLFGYRKKVLASHPEMESAMNDFIDRLLEKQKGKLGTDG